LHYPEWRIKQRFALATLYFATSKEDDTAISGGSNNVTTSDAIAGADTPLFSGLRLDTHECEWITSSGSSTAIMIYDNGTEISTENNTLADQLGLNNASSACDEDGILRRLSLKHGVMNIIPPEISLLSSSLTVLEVQNSVFMADGGNLFSELGSMISLERLVLANDTLIPSPDEDGTLTTTQQLPTKMGRLTNLQELDLRDNTGAFLSGPLPLELGNMRRLGNLQLDGTPFTGSIPFAFAGVWIQLEWLSLENTGINGTLPSPFCFIPHLSFYCSRSLCGCSCICTMDY
jgi:hypothetical protein